MRAVWTWLRRHPPATVGILAAIVLALAVLATYGVVTLTVAARLIVGHDA